MQSQTRRAFLKTLGAGTLAYGATLITDINPLNTLAQTYSTSDEIGGFARFKVGSLNLTAIADGGVDFGVDIFSANVEQAKVEAFLTAYHQPVPVPMIFNVLLVETGERKILVDAGWGDVIYPGSDGNVGKLINTLDLLDISPGAITDVILTHFHPDHLSGISLGDRSNFPNAVVHFPTAELTFIQADSPPAALADFIELANAKLAPVIANDQLQLFTPETELVPGIQAVDAHGHTPGHSALLFASGGDQLLHLSDTVAHPLLPFAHPDWLIAFDLIPEATVATRQTLLGRAADEAIPVFGYHLPFPGVGTVVRDAGAFRFLASVV